MAPQRWFAALGILLMISARSLFSTVSLQRNLGRLSHARPTPRHHCRFLRRDFRGGTSGEIYGCSSNHIAHARFERRNGGGGGKRGRRKGGAKGSRPQTRREQRDVTGILLLDKPFNISSNDALQRVKFIFAASKAGHTGTLDPIATGMLPICLGESTKLAQIITDADKRYIVRAKLGQRTTTSDSEGKVIEERAVQVSEKQLRDAVESFRGKQTQVPSMFSAIKYQGKKLYEYAREGKTVPIQPRPINVFDIKILNFSLESSPSSSSSSSSAGDKLESCPYEYVDMEVHVSKGTYIRTIVDDLGQKLGCGAHVVILRRSQVTSYDPKRMVTMERLEEIAKELDEAAQKTHGKDEDSNGNPNEDASKPSSMLRVDNIKNKEFSRERLKEIFGEAVSYVFYHRGNEEGYVVMGSAEDAQNAVEFVSSAEGQTAVMLDVPDIKVHLMSKREEETYHAQKKAERMLRPSYEAFDSLLLPLDEAVPNLRELVGNSDNVHRIRMGQEVTLSNFPNPESILQGDDTKEGDMLRVTTVEEKDQISKTNALIAIATLEVCDKTNEWKIRPKRIIRPIETSGGNNNRQKSFRGGRGVDGRGARFQSK